MNYYLKNKLLPYILILINVKRQEFCISHYKMNLYQINENDKESRRGPVVAQFMLVLYRFLLVQ